MKDDLEQLRNEIISSFPKDSFGKVKITEIKETLAQINNYEGILLVAMQDPSITMQDLKDLKEVLNQLRDAKEKLISQCPNGVIDASILNALPNKKVR